MHVGDIEQDMRRPAKAMCSAPTFQSFVYILGKPQLFAGTAEEIAKMQRPSDWRRLSAGAGTKGPRLHDWCYLELADLEGEEFNDDSRGLWTRGLLIRRHIANGDLAYWVCRWMACGPGGKSCRSKVTRMPRVTVAKSTVPTGLPSRLTSRAIAWALRAARAGETRPSASRHRINRTDHGVPRKGRRPCHRCCNQGTPEASGRFVVGRAC